MHMSEMEAISPQAQVTYEIDSLFEPLHIKTLHLPQLQNSMPDELSINYYKLRGNVRSVRNESARVFGPVVDVDTSGTFDPGIKYDPFVIAIKEPGRPRESRQFSQIQDNPVQAHRRPKNTTSSVQFMRNCGEQMCLTLSFKSDEGKNKFAKLNELPGRHDHWPELPQESRKDGALVLDNRLRDRNGDRNIDYLLGGSRESKLGQSDYVESAGCLNCVRHPDGEICSLEKGDAYPCTTCRETFEECIPIMEPACKKKCNNCASRRQLLNSCDFIKEPYKRGPCHNCQINRWECVAGPRSKNFAVQRSKALKNQIIMKRNPTTQVIRNGKNTYTEVMLFRCDHCHLCGKICSLENINQDMQGSSCDVCIKLGQTCSHTIRQRRFRNVLEKQQELLRSLQNNSSSPIEEKRLLLGRRFREDRYQMKNSNNRSASKIVPIKNRQEKSLQSVHRSPGNSAPYYVFNYTAILEEDSRSEISSRPTDRFTFSRSPTTIKTEIIGGSVRSTFETTGDDFHQKSFYTSVGSSSAHSRWQFTKARHLESRPVNKICVSTRLSYPVTLNASTSDCSWCCTPLFGWFGTGESRNIEVTIHSDGNWHESAQNKQARFRTVMCKNCTERRLRAAKCSQHRMEQRRQTRTWTRSELLSAYGTIQKHQMAEQIPICEVCINVATKFCVDVERVGCSLILCDNCSRSLEDHASHLEGVVGEKMRKNAGELELRADACMFEHVRVRLKRR